MVIAGTGAMAVNTAAPPVAIGPLGYGLTTLGAATFGIGGDIATAPYRSSEGARLLQSLDTHAPTYLKMNAVEYGAGVFSLGGAKAITHLGSKTMQNASKVASRIRAPSDVVKPQALKHDLVVMTREEAVVKGVTSSSNTSKAEAINTRSRLDNPLLKEPRIQSGGTAIADSGTLGSGDKAAKTMSAQAKYPTTKMSVEKAEKLVAVNVPERPLNSPNYSVVFETKLQHGKHYPGVRDAVHFQESNKQLYDVLSVNSAFKASLENLYPGITKAVTPGPRGAFLTTSPTKVGLTWHHNAYKPGIMELMPKKHHSVGGCCAENIASR